MEKWTIAIIWGAVLATPLAICITAFILWLKTPKQNKFFGYRTKKTLNSEELWVIANKLWGKISAILSLISIIVFIPILYYTIPNKYIIGISVFIPLILLLILIPIIVVEVAVKKNQEQMINNNDN